MNTENKKLNGVEVRCVIPNSCADNAGVRMGDIILAFNGMRTKTLIDYVKAKMLMPERENVLIDRNGKRMYFEWNSAPVV